jgi:spore coat protein SA
LRGLINSLQKLDVVHIHNRPQWVSELRKLGYKGAIWLHLQNDHLGHWKAAALDSLAPQVTGIAVCSAFLRGTFADRSLKLAAKTKIIFNGVNPALFTPREEIREAKTIFFVGRFDEEKGVIHLISAFANLLDRHPDAKLVIGGATGFGSHQETAYVRKVRALAESLVRTRNAQIHFPGYIHHDQDLPSWFQRAAIFTSPSIFQEPFGLVNAEAMACATPVVGSNRGGIPEVLGEAGILINPEEEVQFVAALASLLDNSEERVRLGCMARARCLEMFDWEIIARQWASILEESKHCEPAIPRTHASS